jgi:UDP-GlcNAc:undecaprenyl-phosphate/decaprenyl-phosphate GlcNAc-1-phosphate transferase
MTALDALLAFAVAALASLAVVPLIARLAARLGAVDSPDGRRKKQEKAVPLGGGLAIALAAVLGVGAALSFGAPVDLFQSTNYWYMAIPSVAVLIAVGLVDDFIGLTGIYKLVGQVLAASLLVSAGFQFESISLCGWNFPLGDFGIPFSMFFCLGAMNAFNLIDGADGLAASIGAVVCLTLGVIATSQGAVIAGLTSFAFSGALLGFLRYNAPPAKVYLGDTGSMLIGWLVAAIAIRSSIKEQAAVALTVPVAICAIPILDAAAALVRRMTTGQSVFTADRGHLHHALMLRGWTVGQTAALAAGLTAITCAGAMASYFTDRDAFAVVTAGGVVIALAAARIFGHAEVQLLASHVRSLARGAWRQVRPASASAVDRTDHAIQLQGRRQWHVLWSALREAAAVHHLGSMKLNINMPHLHESFYASWRGNDVVRADGVWRLSLPLNYGGRPIGRLLIEGGASGDSLAEMQLMIDFLEPLASEVARLVEEVEAEGASKPLPAGAVARPGITAGAESLATATDFY